MGNLDIGLAEKVITGLSVLVNVLLGFLIWSRSKKSATGILFFLFTLSLAGASYANFYSLNGTSDSSTLFWIRVVMFFAGLMGPIFYLFVVAFPFEKICIKKWWFVSTIILTIIAMIIALTPLLFSGITHHSNSVQPTPGSGIILYMLVLVSYLILGMIILIKKYFSDDQSMRKRIKFLIMGLTLTLSLIIFFNIILVNIFKNTNYQFLAGFFTLFYVGFTAYSIIKHQLFNIKVIATEATVVILSIALLAELFISRNITEGGITAVIWLVTSYGGWVLIKSVQREIKQREEIQQLAKKLDKANQALEELDETKDNFLSMATHELNTPIAAIEGYLSMIIDEKMAGEINDKALRYLKNVYMSSKRLAALVRDLLNVSRIESNRIHLINEEAQIEDIIEQAIAEVKIKADEVGHKLSFEKPEKLLPKTWFDVARITEVVINLIGNAIKYTDPTGKIVVRAHADDGKIVVSVEDNGRGIPTDRSEHIFEKFSQVDVLKDQVKGTGLGMFISKNLINFHKGQLWFKSSVDPQHHGTTFYFSLPILKEKPVDENEGQGAVIKLK